MNLNNRAVITTQTEWNGIRNRFPSAQDHKKFSKEFEFDPNALLIRTNKTIREAVPKARSDSRNGRYAIFEAMVSGDTVDATNRKAKEISPNATRNGDIFIGLHTNFLRFDR